MLTSNLKSFFNRLPLSNIAIAVVIFACLFLDFKLKNWNKQDRVIEHDIHSYYAYLPAFFIYHDIKFEGERYFLSKNYAMFWPVQTEDGKKVIKMSMGLSILYAPFFFVAHLFALIS